MAKKNLKDNNVADTLAVSKCMMFSKIYKGGYAVPNIGHIRKNTNRFKTRFEPVDMLGFAFAAVRRRNISN